MRIQPISQNVVCMSKKKRKTDDITELSKLGVIFAASGGVILPKDATPETIEKFEKIIQKDFPNYQVSYLEKLLKKIKK